MMDSVKVKWIIGIDEVGRGPLAGPVYVCACAIRADKMERVEWGGLTDSKKMTLRAREEWFAKAKQLRIQDKVRFVYTARSAVQIDNRGITVCIRSCIASALKKIAIDPDEVKVLLDGGLCAPSEYKNQKTIIRGDATETTISLASVIAKVTRDRYMNTIHKKHPLYKWNENKGYGTVAHRRAIKKYGTTAYHRKTFLGRII